MPITVDMSVKVKADLALHCSCEDFAYRSVRGPQTEDELRVRLRNAAAVRIIAVERKYGITSAEVSGTRHEHTVTVVRSDVAPAYVCKHCIAVLKAGISRDPVYVGVDIFLSEEEALAVAGTGGGEVVKANNVFMVVR